MRVIATAVGFDGNVIRNPGDIFDMPDNAGAGDWFKPHKGKKPPAAPTDGDGAPADPQPDQGDGL